MKTNTKRFIAAALFSALLLSACGQPQESPEQVISNFKNAAADVKSADLSIAVDMTGASKEDNLDFKGIVDVKIDRQLEEARKAEVAVDVSGDMRAGGQTLTGDLAFMLRSINTDFYVQLKKLESSDPSVETFKPFLALYTSRWLKLAPELIPENLRALQQKDEAALAREAELKALFKKASLFRVVKEYGMKTVEGHKSYHYGLQMDEQGIRDYLTAAMAIQGREVPPEEMENTMNFVRAVEKADIWIGTDDYQLYKAELTLKSPGDSGTDMQIKLVFTADSYNQPMAIEAPEGAEEFNPLALFMGGGMPEGTPAE